MVWWNCVWGKFLVAQGLFFLLNLAVIQNVSRMQCSLFCLSLAGWRSTKLESGCWAMWCLGSALEWCPLCKVRSEGGYSFSFPKSNSWRGHQRGRQLDDLLEKETCSAPFSFSLKVKGSNGAGQRAPESVAAESHHCGCIQRNQNHLANFGGRLWPWFHKTHVDTTTKITDAFEKRIDHTHTKWNERVTAAEGMDALCLFPLFLQRYLMWKVLIIIKIFLPCLLSCCGLTQDWLSLCWPRCLPSTASTQLSSPC